MHLVEQPPPPTACSQSIVDGDIVVSTKLDGINALKSKLPVHSVQS